MIIELLAERDSTIAQILISLSFTIYCYYYQFEIK